MNTNDFYYEYLRKKDEISDKWENYNRQNREWEETEEELRKLLILSRRTLETLYQQWGSCPEIYRLQESVAEFERQAHMEFEKENDNLKANYQHIMQLEEDSEKFFREEKAKEI